MSLELEKTYHKMQDLSFVNGDVLKIHKIKVFSPD